MSKRKNKSPVKSQLRRPASPFSDFTNADFASLLSGNPYTGRTIVDVDLNNHVDRDATEIVVNLLFNGTKHVCTLRRTR